MGSAQNNLGNALAMLGERESGITHLMEAVTAYRAALEELTPDRAPFQWAGTEHMLGLALATLGWREGGTAHLTEAIAALEASLSVTEYARPEAGVQWVHLAIDEARAEIARRTAK